MRLADHPHVYAFTRTLGAESLLVLGNFSAEHQPLDDLEDRAAWADAEVVLANTPAPTPITDALAPWESVVLRRVR